MGYGAVPANEAKAKKPIPVEPAKQRVLSLPLGYYQRGISIRERTQEEVIPSPDEGWQIQHHFETTTAETYDDNIYDDEDNEIDDFITTLSPNLRVDLITQKLFFSSSYRMDADFYQYIGEGMYDHTVGGMALYRHSPRLMFSLSDIYRKVSTLKGQEGTDQVTTEHGIARTDYNTLSFHGEYDFIRGNNKLWVDYSYRGSGVHYHG